MSELEVLCDLSRSLPFIRVCRPFAGTHLHESRIIPSTEFAASVALLALPDDHDGACIMYRNPVEGGSDLYGA